jgi:transcriptional regulator with XRE-family HTH domain
MPDSKEPTYRAKHFGERLRGLRNAAGFNVKEVGEYLRRGQATVTRFENGTYPVIGDELLKLLNLYRVSDPDERASLLRLADEVNQRGWHEGIITNRFADFVWAEERALAMKVFQFDTVPGILQTEQFARELLTAGPQDQPKVDTLVEARMMRGRILQRKTNPPQAEFLLHENALRQRGASPDVLAAQLDHLVEVAERPHVNLRVLPATSWAHTVAGITSSFRILEMHEDWPALMYVETPVGGVVYEGHDIDSTLEAFNKIWNQDAWDQTRTNEYFVTLMKEVSR